MLTWYRDLHDGSEFGDRELVFRVVNVVLAFDNDRHGGQLSTVRRLKAAAQVSAHVIVQVFIK